MMRSGWQFIMCSGRVQAKRPYSTSSGQCFPTSCGKRVTGLLTIFGHAAQTVWAVYLSLGIFIVGGQVACDVDLELVARAAPILGAERLVVYGSVILAVFGLFIINDQTWGKVGQRENEREDRAKATEGANAYTPGWRALAAFWLARC